MSEIKLVPSDSPILREVCEEVTQIDKNVVELVREMGKIMRQSNGIGIAAPQVGSRLRIFLIRDGESDFVAINPSVKCMGEATEVSPEGCLSLPGLSVRVPRYPEVELEGYFLDGKKFGTTVTGYLARVIQHEYDHLNGLLIDRFLTDKGQDNVAQNRI